jgi:formylmethanofuran dehydrogenase subunit E
LILSKQQVIDNFTNLKIDDLEDTVLHLYKLRKFICAGCKEIIIARSTAMSGDGLCRPCANRERTRKYRAVKKEGE